MPHFRHYHTTGRPATQSWSDLNITIPHGATGELRTTCPQCSAGRHDRNGKSLSVNLREGIWYCHYCHWKGSLTRPGSMPSLPPPGPRQRSPDDIQRRQLALERIWRQAHAVTPTDPVARYLQHRGLWQEPVPDVLRCHPRLPYRHDDEHYTYHPALIASVQGPHGTVASVHRIYLTNSGAKADVPTPKKSMPTPTTVTGAAVRLDSPHETIAITEGIETGLAVSLTTQLPVWAALTAGGMTTIIIPDNVRMVVICADHDTGGTGERAAKQLARRMLAEGRRVKILMPSTPGTDWADGLEGAQHG
jgi:putative DNA primase/helicase